MSKFGDQVSESTITQASGHIGPVPTKQARGNLSTVGDSNEQFSEQTVQVPISKVSLNRLQQKLLLPNPHNFLSLVRLSIFCDKF